MMDTEMKVAFEKAPFPAFGGKSQVADMVWERLGDVRNYIEPFAFTAAVLLRRPSPGPIETINDLNSYVTNFWRAVRADPEAVAAHADWPVIEDDLHARHRWLETSADAQNALQRVRENPEAFDAKIAGWWCWGACCWIGSGWCSSAHQNSVEWKQLPRISDPGNGVTTGPALSQKLPHMDAAGRLINSPPDMKRPQLCNGNTTAGPGVLAHAHIDQKRPRVPSSTMGWMPGVVGSGPDIHRPQLADAYSRGRGVNGNDSLGTCDTRRAWLTNWMMRLADRMRPVRVCCGHWARVCDSDSTLIRLGTTGVFLDPPYRKTINGVENRAADIYANDKAQDVDGLCDEVQAWCLKWGDNPEIRIALCGLEGEYPLLDAAGWECVPWKSRGGYGNRTERGRENAARERIWFNAACVRPTVEQHLFSGVAS